VLILAIESATNQVGCAIGGPAGILASAHTVRPRRHAESLAPQIRFVVEQAGVSMADIDAIAVDVGPGLFTGLRVGITTAMAMAWALGKPVATYTSLELLAAGLSVGDADIVAVVDARRGEVFHARYRRSAAGLESVTEPAVDDPEKLAESISADTSNLVIVGDGARAHAGAFSKIGCAIASVSFDLPSARTLATLAVADPRRFVDSSEVSPLYLREPDAKAKFEHVAGGQS